MSINDRQKYIIVKGFGGLGNRLLTLLNAIAIAKKTGRFLVVDWSDDTYSNTGENSFNFLFDLKNIQFKKIDEMNLKDYTVWPLIWNNKLHYSSRELMFDCINNYNNGYEYFENAVRFEYNNIKNDCKLIIITHELNDPVMTFAKMGILPWYVYLNPKNAFRQIFFKYLQVTLPIKKGVEKILSQSKNKKLIGIHVRASDNPKSSHWSIQEYFHKISKLRNKYTHIFLATDNIDVVSCFRQQYGDFLLWQNQWLPTNPGDRAHANDNCPNKLDHAMSSLIDLLCLSQVDFLIANSESSFSHLALEMRKSKETAIQIGKTEWTTQRSFYKLIKKLFYL